MVTRESGLAARAGVIHLGDRTVRRLRLVAWTIGAAAVAVLTVMAVLGMIPENPEGDWIRPAETQIEIILLVVVALGLLLSITRAAVGAAIVALAGTALAVFSGVAYPPIVVAVTAAAFLVPAVLLWLAWQHDQTLIRIVVLAVVTFGLLTGAWVGGTQIYNGFFGVAAPQSTTTPLTDSAVRWAWAGGVTDRSFTVVMKPRTATGAVGLLVTPAGGTERLADEVTVTDGVARLEAGDLAPGVEHSYRFSLDGVIDPVWVGRVGTFPSPDDTEASVSIAFASCARTGTNAAVFDEIRRLAPDMFVITGDLHYENIASNDVGAFHRAYDTILGKGAPSAMTREVPVAYMWDDHDFGGNDVDHTSSSKPAATAAYRSDVPHPPLPLQSSLAQTLDVGPVRLLITDLRSERNPDEQTLLGLEQRAWLEQQLLAARDTVPLVIWVSPSPWIAAAKADGDSWSGFAAERRDLANFVRDHHIDNLMIVTGDAHMVAIDDGTNSDYSTGATAGPAPSIPVLAAAALDRPGSKKGGPYSEGMFPGAGQFGLVTAALNGNELKVRLEGRTGDGQVLVAYEFTHSLP